MKIGPLVYSNFPNIWEWVISRYFIPFPISILIPRISVLMMMICWLRWWRRYRQSRRFPLNRSEVKSSIHFLMSWHPSNVWQQGSGIRFASIKIEILFPPLWMSNEKYLLAICGDLEVKAFRLIPNAGQRGKRPNREAGLILLSCFPHTQTWTCDKKTYYGVFATHQVLLGICYHCLSTSNVIK